MSLDNPSSIEEMIEAVELARSTEHLPPKEQFHPMVGNGFVMDLCTRIIALEQR